MQRGAVGVKRVTGEAAFRTIPRLPKRQMGLTCTLRVDSAWQGVALEIASVTSSADQAEAGAQMFNSRGITIQQ